MTIYQDQHGNRVEADLSADPVKFWGQGGGFERWCTRALFDECFSVAPDPTFRAAAASADWLTDPDDPEARVYLACLSDDERWNGCAMPYFERAAVNRLCKLVPNVRWADNAVDVLVQDDDAEPEKGVPAGWYKVIPCLIAGVLAWPVGAGSWTWNACVVIPTLDETIARMKAEVLADLADAMTPRTINSFADLHDYCDANCYGGFCEDEFNDALLGHFGGRDTDGGWPQAMHDYINAAQDAIDAWIKAGGHRENP